MTQPELAKRLRPEKYFWCRLRGWLYVQNREGKNCRSIEAGCVGEDFKNDFVEK